MTNKATILGTVYTVGMMLPFGSTGGLPDFGEIQQIIIVQETPVLVLKLLSGWYCEHLRTFKVEPTGETEILKHSELKETYPLAAYITADGRMVSLKHFICTSECNGMTIILSSPSSSRMTIKVYLFKFPLKQISIYLFIYFLVEET